MSQCVHHMFLRMYHAVVPGPPVNSACSFPVPGETFTVLWSPPPDGVVGGAEYSVTTTGVCGSCTTSGLMTSCSGWTAMGQTCTFTAQTTTSDCGLTSRMSEPETIVLRGEWKLYVYSVLISLCCH